MLPPRCHDAAQLMRWVERGIHVHQRHHDEGFDDDSELPEHLPTPPFPEFRNDEVAITPVHTKDALLAEGRTMHHCVVTYAGALAAGVVALYHVEHRTGSSTLMLQLDHAGGWRVREHNGPFNRDVPIEAQNLVRSWIETSVVALLCPPPKVGEEADSVDSPDA